MDEANRINTTDELRAIRAAGFGFIVNVDRPTRTTTFHTPDCRTLTDERDKTGDPVEGAVKHCRDELLLRAPGSRIDDPRVARLSRGSSALDDAATAVLQSSQPAKLHHLGIEPLAVVSRGHAGQVADGGDLGLNAAS
jgi:hypothetical protein